MNPNLPIEIHRQVVYSGKTAVKILANNEELSAQQINQCFDHGSVWLETTGKPTRLYDSKTLLKPGQKLHLYCNQSTLSTCPYTPELVDDKIDFSVWSKPSGMLSQGSKWGDHWTIQRWIKQHVWPQRECLITHRLDRFTEGLIIVAHNDSINRQFHRLFENRAIKKTYRAIVSGEMPTGQTKEINSPIEGKSAKTHIQILERRSDPACSLLEIKPETGRKHQIRIHLAETGHPVLNDRIYGQEPFTGDLMLQASSLEFDHPTLQTPMHIEIPVDKCLSLQKIGPS